ncbi:MAG: hypothetical protein ACK5KL_01780 [Dysgonomonas sp.]
MKRIKVFIIKIILIVGVFAFYGLSVNKIRESEYRIDRVIDEISEVSSFEKNIEIGIGLFIACGLSWFFCKKIDEKEREKENKTNQ